MLVATGLAWQVGCKAGDAGNTGSGGSNGTGSGGSKGTGGSSSGGSSASGGGPSSGGSTASGGVTASGGATGTGGVTSSGGATGSGGSTVGSGGNAPPTDASVSDAACQMATVAFTPKIPNVLVLLDGSGSMFDTYMGTTRWDALKKAVLPIITSLETQVNFGLATFSGLMPNMCPIFKSVPIAPMNAMAITSAYPSKMTLDPSNGSMGSLQTPMTMAMPKIPPLFAAAKGDGSNYILFVTDGEPDFCDNGNVTCPVDGVIAGLHDLAVKGITTYVIGLAADITKSTCPGILQGYANAGQNLGIGNPCPGHNIGSECGGVAPWKALATAAGRPAGAALADYVDLVVAAGGAGGAGGTNGAGGAPGVPVAGKAKVYEPNVADQASLTSTLAGLFNGVKSCTFDLGNLNGQSIKVDLKQLTMAHVCLGKTCTGGVGELPQDATNGWSMATATQLTLNGTACDKWRMPNNNDISFDFPCNSIIFE